MYCILRLALGLRCNVPKRMAEPDTCSSPTASECRPAMHRAKVVLPLPDSPTTATHSDGATEKEMSLSTRCPAYAANRLDTTSVGPSGLSRNSELCAGASSGRLLAATTPN